jgi:hypothetical protein
MQRLTLLLAIGLAATLARDAAAAPPWVDRSLTLPSGDWAFDLGVGTAAPPPANAGLNLEMGVGLTSRIELGVRTGLRFGDGFARGQHPDAYGRLFDLQTFDQGGEVVANPEVRLRGALVRGEVGEVALEGRVVLPFEPGTDVGLMFGVPVALHLGNRVRLDTGAYLPVVVGRPGGPPFLPGVVGRPGGASFALSVPLDVWIQATSRFWLGPISDFVIDSNGNASAAIGLGLGYQITRGIDFKAMALFPIPDRDLENWGIGVGLQFRIE